MVYALSLRFLLLVFFSLAWMSSGVYFDVPMSSQLWLNFAAVLASTMVFVCAGMVWSASSRLLRWVQSLLCVAVLLPAAFSTWVLWSF